MNIVERFAFEVPMKPVAKERPRSRPDGRPWTPKGTIVGEQTIATIWAANGRPRLEDGPITLVVENVYERPRSHFTKSGELRQGKAEAIPGPVTDWDNLGKLACDSLNGLAWSDDRLIVDGRSVKRWAEEGEHAKVVIGAWAHNGRTP